MSGHTHDHIDWADRLVLLRAADALDAPAQAAIAARLVEKLPANPTVIDLGCGAGGMSTHFAQALAAANGGTIVLVDATPELLHEAERAVRAAVDAAQPADGLAPDGNTQRPDGRFATAGGAEPTVEEGSAERSGARLAASGGAEPTVEDGNAEPPGARLATVEGIEPTVEEGSAERSGGQLATAEGTAPTVEVRAVVADLADAALPDLLPAADLVWASRVVHHLPDQQAAIGTLAAVARAGGVVALAEGGLSFSCLPWDLGIGRPGLEDRLQAAQAEWFVGMREGIDGSVPMPYGWTVALERAGLADVSSFSALVDHPAPGPDGLVGYVHHHLSRLATHGADHLAEEDRATLASLLDPDSPHYLGKRHDLFLLGARTVHHGRRP
ncbi:methyltransferase domain-containing protein [Amycolatopsis circi]|uniref:methyltransferase domain-containing protein n=1 Tax=Amycolatopsis circi TaxID=871959 RepID=UPI0013BE97ED|nr:class I SAM-dependent methyltransferase [Amycolatopsis circi]